MTSDSLYDNIHALEVQRELEKLSIIPTDSSLVSYNRTIGGGSANIFFELSFENSSRIFLQKIFLYKDCDESATFEYNTLKTLFENNLNVPQPYFLKATPNTRNSPYFVMEKIEGLRLVDVKIRNPSLYDQLMEKLLKGLFKIHNLDLRLFPTIPIPNIQENPYAPIDQKLTVFKIYLEGCPEELKELKPVFEWLERNKTHYPCEELVVTHGDYHSFNILVQEDQVFKILDWNSMSLNDFRMDVAYTVTTESYFDEKQTSKERLNRASLLASKYERISGKKIEGLLYFMILGCNFNLIRLYSQIHNPNITGETKETIAFFHSVNDYFLFLAYVIEETCNLELKQIKEYFSSNFL